MLRLLVALACALLALAGPTGAQAPDRNTPPAPGPAPALKRPEIHKRQLSNGLPVWIVGLHEVPIVQVNLIVLDGTAADPPGKFGIASLTSAMLPEGAGTRSSLEIAEDIDYLGASLTSTSGIDSAAVRLHVPVARLADALPIMADVALRPTFPSDELARVRQQRLTSLLQARDDPASVASLAFSRVLYGPHHRYGTATVGTTGTIETFTAEDVRGFYHSKFRPTNATLLVVGDVVADEVLPMLETSFGGWKDHGAAPVRVALPEVSQPERRQIVLVDRPGAPQSQIRIGWIGVPRRTADYFPIRIMNTILGGAFTSRLNMNLREKHGYTYGARSDFDMRAEAGPFTAYGGVQTDKTAESLTEFFKELTGIRQPIPADEISRAKNYVALRFPGGFETTGDISRRLEEVVVYGLPDDYFSRYVQNIQAVTAADVERVAREYLDPGRFLVVVVGDLKTIEPRIRALDLGPIRTMTVDEVFAPAQGPGGGGQILIFPRVSSRADTAERPRVSSEVDVSGKIKI